MNYSFWEKKYLESPSDITIIGSGIVGLSTAISIKEKQPWLTVKVLERGYQPYGASTKNAGFSCFGSISELLDDIATMGEESCAEVVQMRWKGLKKLKERVGENTLEYKHCGGTEVFHKTENELKDLCLSKIDFSNDFIKDTIQLENCFSIRPNTSLREFSATNIYNAYEGVINPMSMMEALMQKCHHLSIQIIYGVEISKIDYTNKILKTTANHQINYHKLILCTNGFTHNLLPNLPVIPARNQVLITKPLENNPLTSAYHLDKGYVYFREYDSRILLGGGRNLDIDVETTDQFGTTEKIQNYLVQILESICPGASKEIDYWWSGILGIGPTKYPICEWVDDDVLAGVRLGGMGVAIGSYLGDVLAEKVVHA